MKRITEDAMKYLSLLPNEVRDEAVQLLTSIAACEASLATGSFTRHEEPHELEQLALDSAHRLGALCVPHMLGADINVAD